MLKIFLGAVIDTSPSSVQPFNVDGWFMVYRFGFKLMLRRVL
jgi:hypothetical protein